MIINREQQQSYEDTYGNEVKRRRMNDDGGHLKVWRAYQTSYAEREFVAEDEEIRIVQEVVVKEEDQAQDQDQQQQQYQQNQIFILIIL